MTAPSQTPEAAGLEAEKRLAGIAAAVEFGRGNGIHFREEGAVILASDIRSVLATAASAQAAIDAEKARADRLAKDATGLLAEIASFGRAFMTVQESLASTSTPDAYDDAILAASLHYKVVVKTASALYRAALQQETQP